MTECKSASQMKKPSKKHHYLPQFYLKGFTNSQNTFFVYDKRKDNIFLTNPSGAFFENNLNAVLFPGGDSSDLLEEGYTAIENQCWGSLNKIRESNEKTPIKVSDAMNLFLFLLFLHWRLPSNVEVVEKLSEKAFEEIGEFDWLKLLNKSGEKAPKEVREIIRQSQAFKKAFKHIIPFVPFFKDDWVARLVNWRFFYTKDNKSWNIVGDSPIISMGDSDNDPVNCLKEFVFPVSGKILLVSLNKPPNRVLPPAFSIEFNAAMMERSQRFVACKSLEFLEALVKYYKVYAYFGKTDTIIPEMFKMLDPI